MGWWAYRQPLAQGRIVQQNAPWSTVALGGQVEGRAIARHHAASLLAIDQRRTPAIARDQRSEEHTSELQSLMRISYAVFCLKKQKNHHKHTHLSYTNRI